jgi:hypothetical protein
MRYGLLQRAPWLVHALRVVYEVVCICFEAAHHLVLFRYASCPLFPFLAFHLVLFRYASCRVPLLLLPRFPFLTFPYIISTLLYCHLVSTLLQSHTLPLPCKHPPSPPDPPFFPSLFPWTFVLVSLD